MTTEAEARAKVQAYLRTDDFELEEFTEGWAVIRPIPRDLVGSATFVVERATGYLLMFPSSVPQGYVAEDFDEVRPLGRVVEEAPG